MKELIIRNRVFSGILLAPMGLWLAHPCEGLLIGLGSLIMLGGLCLRSWAAGYIKKDKMLAMEGPYSLVRNPLYLGSFLMASGLCIVFSCPDHPLKTVGLWTIFLIYFSLVYGIKIKQEEEFLSSVFKTEWPPYTRTVPAFFPIPWRIRIILGQGFSWKQWSYNREYNAWVGCLFILVAVYFLKIR